MVILGQLLDGLRAACAAFPGKRKGGSVPYTMADIGLPAVSLFFMRPEPFIAYQRSLEKGRQEENSRRQSHSADARSRASLASAISFDQAVTRLRDHDGIKEFQRLDGRTLIALDGTEYFCSQKLGCPHCRQVRYTGLAKSA